MLTFNILKGGFKTMACCSNTTTSTCNSCGGSYGYKSNGFLLVIVLYILLAIILGSYIC